ncbi:MAG: Hpt domain-containing protein [Agarilytica sp.]
MSEEIDENNLAMLKDLLGDKFDELVDTFLQDSRQRYKAMQVGLDNGDINELRHQVHGLKGSCRNIGVNPLADLCQILETQAEEGTLKNELQQMAAIEQKLAVVSELLKKSV